MSGDTSDTNSDYLPGSQDQKVSDVDIYEQLIASEGNMSHAARELNMSRMRLKARIEKNITLTSLMQDMREDVVDNAEQNVFADVRRNDATANRFVLQTLGKSRGWSQGVAGTGNGGEIVVQIQKLAPE